MNNVLILKGPPAAASAYCVEYIERQQQERREQIAHQSINQSIGSTLSLSSERDNCHHFIMPKRRKDATPTSSSSSSQRLLSECPSVAANPNDLEAVKVTGADVKDARMISSSESQEAFDERTK